MKELKNSDIVSIYEMVRNEWDNGIPVEHTTVLVRSQGYDVDEQIIQSLYESNEKSYGESIGIIKRGIVA